MADSFADLEDDVGVDGSFHPPSAKTSSVDAKTEKFPCQQCGGTGQYQGRRTQQSKSHCFACRGKGYFMTSERDRQKASEQRKAKAMADKAAKQAEFDEEWPDLIAGLREAASFSDFAASLVGSFEGYGSLTERQVIAGQNMLAKLEKARQERAKAVAPVTVDLTPIRQMFETAVENGAKKPTYRALGLVISRAPDHGKNPGALYVKNEGDDYGGKIIGTNYHPSREAQQRGFVLIDYTDFDGARETAELTALDALSAIAADPLKVAIEYGRQTGRCSCCGRTLTNAKSIELGIGPICRAGWGL